MDGIVSLKAMIEPGNQPRSTLRSRLLGGKYCFHVRLPDVGIATAAKAAQEIKAAEYLRKPQQAFFIDRGRLENLFSALISLLGRDGPRRIQSAEQNQEQQNAKLHKSN